MIADKRARKLADIVIDYSLSLNEEDTLLIVAEKPFQDFAQILSEKTAERKAKILTDFFDLNEKRALIERNDREELEKECNRLCKLYDKASARVRIHAESNPKYLEGVAPEKIAERRRVIEKPLFDRILGNGKEFPGMKWNVVAIPCLAHARDAGMSLEEYSDFLYNAINIDWQKEAEKLRKIKDKFDNAEDVDIYVPGQTSLHLSLKGRGSQFSAGKFNLPDGEVFYGPVEDSAQGYIYFPYPSIESGNEVEGITLKYENGEVTDFKAAKNQAFLEKMLDLEGVRRIGEFGIGCNYNIDKYIRNILFDEKMGGTIHLALGLSYPKPLDAGGGLNKADIHWDLVCDLRKVSGLPGGRLYVNGQLVQKDGIWQF